MSQPSDERLMTIADLSTMLGVPVDTLNGWRHRGERPSGCRISRHIRYAAPASRRGWKSSLAAFNPQGNKGWPTSSRLAMTWPTPSTALKWLPVAATVSAI
jgi:hypothetical protein